MTTALGSAATTKTETARTAGDAPTDRDVDAAEYQRLFGAEIGDGVVALLATMPFGTGSRYVTITAPTPLGPAILATGGDAVTRQVSGWLGADRLSQLVNAGRAKGRVRVTDEKETWTGDEIGLGPARWFPDVAVEVGQPVAKLVDESLRRIVPRYIDAAVAVGIAEEKRRQMSLLTPPGPATTDILPSHPVDERTIAALVRFASFDYQGYRAANPAQQGGLGITRPVRFRWEAPRTGSYWIRVSSPPDPTVEEVATGLFGSPAFAHEVSVAAAPLFGIADATLLMPPHRETLAGLGVDVRKRADPLREATTGPLAEEVAKSQSADVPSSAVTKMDVLRCIDENLAILAGIATSGARFGMDKGPYVESMRPLVQRLQERRRRLLAGTDQEALTWAAQVEAQQSVLTGVAFGFDRHVHRLDDLTKMVQDATVKLGAFNLPPYVREAMLRVAMGYATAAAASDVPKNAAAILAQADDEAAELPIVFLEGTLASIQRVADDARHAKRSEGGEWSSYDVADMRRREEQYKARLARVRLLMRTDPTAAVKELGEVQALILDLQVESELVGNMDQIDAVWQALDDSLSFWFSSLATRIRIGALKARSDEWHARWKRIHQTWKSGDAAAKAQAKKDFDTLRADPKLRDFFGAVQAAIKDARTEELIGKLVALIAITVITAGIGDIVLAGTVGWELGVGGTALVVGGAEALTFTLLSQIFLDEDHSLGHIGYEFATNWAMFSVMRRFAMFAEIAKLATVTKFGGQAILLGAMTFAKADLDKYREEGRHLTKEEAKVIALQGIAMYIAMHAVAPLTKPIFAELEGSAYAFGSRLRANNRTQNALAARAEALKGTRDIKEAQAYVTAEKTWLEQRIAILGEIEAAAAKEGTKPGGVAAKIKMSPIELAALKAELQTHVETVAKAEVPLLALEPKGPGLFTCPREQIGPVLSALGEQIGVTVDPQTTVKTYRVRTPDGSVIKVMEKLDPATEWLAELKNSLTPVQLKRLEIWTVGKSPKEVHDFFGGSIESAKTRLSGLKLPPDLVEIRAALSDKARAAFDAKFRRMVRDPREPTEKDLANFRKYLESVTQRNGGDRNAGLEAEAEKLAAGAGLTPSPEAEYPKSWTVFESSNNAAFKEKLEAFRGTDKMEPDFQGGEGRIFTGRTEGKALKRWYAERIKDMPTSLELLAEAEAAVARDPKLSSTMEVVKVHERGPDWIVRDFVTDSTVLPESGAAETARTTAISALEGKSSLGRAEGSLLAKLRGRSDNLHWSPSKGKIIVIDMQ